MSGARFEIRVRLALAHFELDVDVASQARSLAVFGPSGAGKSSLIEAIAGWRAPLAGTVRVAGRTLLDRAAGVALPIEERGVGYVPQDGLLMPNWSVGRTLRDAARARAAQPVETAHEQRTLETLEIGHLLERRCQDLSGGERQRVALARALLSRPRFLALDEPLGALDEPLRRRILPYLMRVRDRFDLPMLLVSHDATEVQALCDDMIALEAGRVVAHGPPDEVLRAARFGRQAIDNVLSGRVAEVRDGTAELALDDGGTACVPGRGLARGERAVFAIGSEDVLIALDAPSRISARNVLEARIETLSDSEGGVGEAVRVDARLAGGRGARLSVSLTRASTRELGLRAGQIAILVFKTNACRVLTGRPDSAE